MPLVRMPVIVGREVCVRVPDRLVPMAIRVPHGRCFVRAMVVVMVVVFVLMLMLI